MTVCSQKDSVFSVRHVKVGGAMQKCQEEKQAFPKQGEGQKRDDTQKAHSVEASVGVLVFVGNIPLQGVGRGGRGGKASPGYKGWGCPSQRKQELQLPRISGKADTRVESWLGEQAWDTGLGTAWRKLPLFFLSLPASTHPHPHTPPLLAKRTSLHSGRNGLETLKSLLETCLRHGFVFSRLQCPPEKMSSVHCWKAIQSLFRWVNEKN